MSWLPGEGYDIRNGVKLVSKGKKKAMKQLIKKTKKQNNKKKASQKLLRSVGARAVMRCGPS